MAGRTPEEWEAALEHAVDHPEHLDALLAELDREVLAESSWIRDNPAPSRLTRALLRWLGRGDEDRAELEARLKRELAWERGLVKRYRTWLPRESYQDRLSLYLKDFPAEVAPDPTGLQLPGFSRYAGVYRSATTSQVFCFFVDDRFPGRDPANFSLRFEATTGELVLERLYKKELPRPPDGRPVGRVIVRELALDLVGDPARIRQIEVDNAANQETRKALMITREEDGRLAFEPRPGADPRKTPLGHFMVKLAGELGLAELEMRFFVQLLGVIRIELDTAPR